MWTGSQQQGEKTPETMQIARVTNGAGVPKTKGSGPDEICHRYDQKYPAATATWSVLKFTRVLMRSKGVVSLPDSQTACFQCALNQRSAVDDPSGLSTIDGKKLQCLFLSITNSMWLWPKNAVSVITQRSGRFNGKRPISGINDSSMIEPLSSACIPASFYHD